jgi:uncharacterized membrane protein
MMGKGRLEAFSDGVIAILITIMVLELKVPHSGDLHALRPLLPEILSYVVSFIYIGIYWNNHHHMLHIVRHIDGSVMWANLHLLFWLSLIPAVTNWVGENPHASAPAALYGLVLLMCGVAFMVLQRRLIHRHGQDSPLARAVGSDLKGKLAPVAYAVAICLAFVHPWLADAIYVLVAATWIVPDRRFARAAAHDQLGETDR